MSCSVAVSKSPVFSSPSPLSLTLTHLKPSATCCQNPSSSPSSPCSPIRLRLQKPPPHPTCFSNPASGSMSPTQVKRKRPARLSIPVVAPVSFEAPETPAVREMMEDGDGYSVYGKKGRREAMEDRFSAAANLQGDCKQAFFGVYDGHGGAKAAEFAAANLDKKILNEIAQRGDEQIVDAVKYGYLNTDSEFLKEDAQGGSCCVTALIRNGNLVVSNAGDCRAVMSRGGVAEALTCDHRPSREDEKERIETSGGYVASVHGVSRIQGSLAISRGIGDQHVKKWVIAEPETEVLKIRPNHEFLILASDGLWDKVSNQEAVDIARPLCVGVDKAELLIACKKLVDLARSRENCDDATVMIVRLGHYI